MKIKKVLQCFLCILLTLSMYFVSPQKVEALSQEEILAPSAILIEENTGQILFEKNSHEKRACASVTKVMTLLLVFEALESNKISMDDIVTTSEKAASMGGSDIWLEPGEKMSVDDLIKATVVASANDAAVALAEHVSGSADEFIKQMNIRANELEMHDTTFKNCNGLDEEGHLTSAYDVAIMSKELIKHDKIYDYTSIWMDFLRGEDTQIVNTNKLLQTYDGITGLKTGTTSQAGSCISATAKRENLSLIAVVLGSDTGKERFDSAAKLLDFGFANFETVSPELKEEVKPVEIIGGMEKQVATTVDISGNFLIDKGQKENIKSEIVYYSEITAPIKEGQTVGSVTYTLGEEKIATYEILAQNEVKEISFISVLLLMISNLFII